MFTALVTLGVLLVILSIEVMTHGREKRMDAQWERFELEYERRRTIANNRKVLRRLALVQMELDQS